MVAVRNLPKPSYEELSDAFEKARQDLQRANQKIREQEQEIRRLKTEDWQRRELRKKKEFKPAEKDYIIELERLIESPHTHKDEEGFTRICHTTVAKNTGTSESTAKRKSEAIPEQWPDWPVEMKTVTENEDGKVMDRLYIKKKFDTSLIQAAIDATLSEEKKRKQGGNQYECQGRLPSGETCGSRNVRIDKVLVCEDCGHKSPLESTYPNGNLKNKKSKTRKSNLLLKNNPVDSTSDESDTGETVRSNLLSEEDTEAGAKNFDESVQLDDVIQESRHRQVDSELTVDSNSAPPLVPADHIGILKNWIQKRRGTPRVIQATGQLETARKYVSKPEAYEPDIEAFIAGKIGHIYGSRLNNPETGLTSVVCFECDTSEHSEIAMNSMQTLARAGIGAICHERQRERAHFEVYFDQPVDPQVAYQLLLEICPDLEAIPEVFPCSGIENRTNHPLSWPMWQRIGGQVYPCKALSILPAPHDGAMREAGPTDLETLAQLVTDAVTPVAMVEEFATVLAEREVQQKGEQEREGMGGGAIGIQSKPITQVQGDDLIPHVLADFDAQHSWQDLAVPCGGLVDGRFCAIWRGSISKSVVIDPRNEKYAHDYGQVGSYRSHFDKHQAWCYIHGKDRTADLAERCAELRRQQSTVSNSEISEEQRQLQIGEAVPSELFPTEQKPVAPVYTPCIRCGKPKSIKRADGALVCGTDHSKE